MTKANLQIWHALLLNKKPLCDDSSGRSEIVPLKKIDAGLIASH